MQEHYDYVQSTPAVARQFRRACSLLLEGKIQGVLVTTLYGEECTQSKVFYDKETEKFNILYSFGRKQIVSNKCMSLSTVTSLHDADDCQISLIYEDSVADRIARHLASTGKFNY